MRGVSFLAASSLSSMQARVIDGMNIPPIAVVNV